MKKVKMEKHEQKTALKGTGRKDKEKKRKNVELERGKEKRRTMKATKNGEKQKKIKTEKHKYTAPGLLIDENNG